MGWGVQKKQVWRQFGRVRVCIPTDFGASTLFCSPLFAGGFTVITMPLQSKAKYRPTPAMVREAGRASSSLPIVAIVHRPHEATQPL